MKQLVANMNLSFSLALGCVYSKVIEIILGPGAVVYYSSLTFPPPTLLFPKAQLKSTPHNLNGLSGRSTVLLNLLDPNYQTN